MLALTHLPVAAERTHSHRRRAIAMSYRDVEDKRLGRELAELPAAGGAAPAAGGAGPLSALEISHFKEHGFVLLRGLIDPATVLEWRGVLCYHIAATVSGFDASDDSTWPAGDGFAEAQVQMPTRIMPYSIQWCCGLAQWR